MKTLISFICSLFSINFENVVYAIIPGSWVNPYRPNNNVGDLSRFQGRTVNFYILTTDGHYDLIVEGDGPLGKQINPLNNTKVYLKPNALPTQLIAGKVTVYKRQMNANLSDDVAISSLDFDFTDFNDNVEGVLLHDFGQSENPVAFKVVVTEAFENIPD